MSDHTIVMIERITQRLDELLVENSEIKNENTKISNELTQLHIENQTTIDDLNKQLREAHSLRDTAIKSLGAATEELVSVKREKDALESNCLKISGEILKFAKCHLAKHACLLCIIRASDTGQRDKLTYSKGFQPVRRQAHHKRDQEVGHLIRVVRGGTGRIANAPLSITEPPLFFTTFISSFFSFSHSTLTAVSVTMSAASETTFTYYGLHGQYCLGQLLGASGAARSTRIDRLMRDALSTKPASPPGPSEDVLRILSPSRVARTAVAVSQAAYKRQRGTFGGRGLVQLRDVQGNVANWTPDAQWR
ncbi:hypothetical protein HYPSUDRAFT_60035 [Hypholoma sublateritium FD-334 SS-4]|uniref:Uncharacterized protein n=1 Tax=Hypholoma sublateritium (strain FD-334 SS-4) TaxID=945553 RepID=A0A0D2N1Z0_HYPSF|nr:hypothetical protein HYPSUDRAFT_60035 [Hypholoma sublateritium FD-334 SS-4]